MSSNNDEARSATPGKQKKQFDLRGDLHMLMSGDLSDSVVICADSKFATHKAFLISRSGWFRKKLNNHNFNETDKRVIEVTSHTPADVYLVLEFIYGAEMVEIAEKPSIEKSFISTCGRIYCLGQYFDIPNMAEYAANHLGNYLSTKLKEICVFPTSRAQEAFHRHKFPQHLEDGIVTLDRFQQSGKDNELPLKMLVDFVVAGGEIILRDAGFQWDISQDVIPTGFVKEVLLARYRETYQTGWMVGLMERPEATPDKRVKCVVCEVGVNVKCGKGAHYNPKAQAPLTSVYTQWCCDSCAKDEDYLDEDGMFSWNTFQ